jgi:hypothetical protein
MKKKTRSKIRNKNFVYLGNFLILIGCIIILYVAGIMFEYRHDARSLGGIMRHYDGRLWLSLISIIVGMIIKNYKKK